MALDLELISKYDGLLLVHPEWFAYNGISSPRGIRSAYENFRSAQDYCDEHSVPFMVALSCGDNRDLSPIDKLKLKPSYDEISSDNIVDDVAKTVGKVPSEISLLFGGFISDKCVADWVVNLCQNVEYSSENEKLIMDRFGVTKFWKNPIMFKNGRIHYDLTDQMYRKQKPLNIDHQQEDTCLI